MVKKINIKKGIIFVAAFILGVLIIVGQGSYKKTLAKESVQLGVNLLGDSVKPIVYDIQNQGIPKSLVQPGRISIATGHGASGVVNKGKEPVLVQVNVTGISGDVQLTSTDISFEPQTGKFKKAIEPGKELNISLLLDIPRSELKKNVISDGKVEFTDYESGKILATLPLKIINSSVNN